MTTLTDKRKKLTSAKSKNSKNLKKPRQGLKKRNSYKKIKQPEELIALTQTWDEDLCE